LLTFQRFRLLVFTFFNILMSGAEDNDRPQKKSRFVAAKGLKLTKIPQNLISRPPPPGPTPPQAKFVPPKPSANEMRRSVADTLFAGLTKEQQLACKNTNSSAFISGAAGSGKSTLFKYLVAEAKVSLCLGVCFVFVLLYFPLSKVSQQQHWNWGNWIHGRCCSECWRHDNPSVEWVFSLFWCFFLTTLWKNWNW
jgi:hypothetical protein